MVIRATRSIPPPYPMIAKPGDSARLAQRIIEETGSLGVRISATRHRLIAKRKMEPVRVGIDGAEWDGRGQDSDR